MVGHHPDHFKSGRATNMIRFTNLTTLSQAGNLAWWGMARTDPKTIYCVLAPWSFCKGNPDWVKKQFLTCVAAPSITHVSTLQHCWPRTPGPPPIFEIFTLIFPPSHFHAHLHPSLLDPLGFLGSSHLDHLGSLPSSHLQHLDFHPSHFDCLWPICLALAFWE